MGMPIPKLDTNSLKLKEFCNNNSDYKFLSFRHKVSSNPTLVCMK
jgi:hypothetical protein